MKVVDSERIPIKLWLEDMEEGALQQARNLANLPFAYKWIAIMPDSHQGYGMPIGGVLATEQVVIPNAVGVDIGCGVAATRTTLKEANRDTLSDLLEEIKRVVPLGFRHHKDKQPWKGFDRAPDVEVIQRELDSARCQLGTLGGGNHFIEVQRGDDGFIWLMLHSGSRNFGLQAASDYHKKAIALCQKRQFDVPDKDLSFLPLDSREGEEYLEAMNYCLDFARANRELMMARIEEIVRRKTRAEMVERIDIHHNYAALEKHFGKIVLVHRKGATKASRGQVGIIPGSMGTPSYIVEGLGNEESFESCSHGAGRRLGRNEAIRSLSLEDEQKKMEGIIHGLTSQKKLDEAPGSYKDIDEVMANQRDLVRIRVKLRPLAVIKG